MKKSDDGFALLIACLVENMELNAQVNKYADDLEGSKNKTKMRLHEPMGNSLMNTSIKGLPEM